jgi:hypothetical protein
MSLGAGVAFAGVRLADALYAARAADRYVTVKGLAEREVEADLVLWPVVFTATGADLAAVQARIDADAGRIGAFLEAHGFAAGDWSSSAPRVTDRIAQGVQPVAGQPFDRYMVEATVTVRSSRIADVNSAMRASGDLVAQGVAIVRSYEFNPQYLFTQLERIKPEMIAEATADARAAAQKFAADSGSQVGAIRNAQQGYFSIEDRDSFSPEVKRIRVVTTIQYFLRDE